MKKVITVLMAATLAMLTLSGCGEITNAVKEALTTSATGITELKLLSAADVSLEVGKTDKSYFTVKATGEFKAEDIEFVSGDTSIALFEYESTALTTFIYYKITGVSAGKAPVYAQTKDGVIKSEVINVTVTGKAATTAGTTTDNSSYLVQSSLKILKDSYAGVADIKVDENLKFFSIIPTQTAFINDLLAIINKDSATLETWSKTVDSIKDVSKSVSDILPGYSIALVNPVNKDNVLLTVYDGVVVYNFVDG